MNKKKFLIFLILLFSTQLFSQRLLKISVSVDGENKSLSYINRKGTDFVSSKELATLLSGSFFYNPVNEKIELKFENYNLKITSKNQFVILTARTDNNQQVFQVPVSTLSVNDDIFIPLLYSVSFLGIASDRSISYNPAKKNLTVSERLSNSIAGPPSNNDDSPPDVRSNFDIYGISIEEKANGTLIRFKSQKKIPKYSNTEKDGILYLHVTGVTVDPGVLKNFKPNSLIRSAAYKNTAENNIQFEFKLGEGFESSEAFKDIDSHDLLLTIHNTMLSGIVKDLEAEKSKWQFDVVVIDAGHGGKDPGTIGVSGIYEKDINLAVALKLGKLIQDNMKGVEVVYTRKTDTFVELYKRGKIANENGGKLFISIHCNAMPKKPSDTRGFEVYLLRPGRTDEAITIAELENSVIKYEDDPAKYQKLNDENFILVSMAHSSYMRYSEMFSDILNQTWSSSVDIPSRGVKQAGFYVLVGASMPGVLIEAGYLSNKKDESYLNSVQGQNQVANAIYNSIATYRQYYNRIFDEGAL